MSEKRFINDIDNGQLIDRKGELSTIDYSDKVDFYELWEFLNKLNDENRWLKAQLYCPFDSICARCQHEHLVHTGDKFYISKCRKGHEECSKGDVKYCNDFKLKGDVE